MGGRGQGDTLNITVSRPRIIPPLTGQQCPLVHTEVSIEGRSLAGESGARYLADGIGHQPGAGPGSRHAAGHESGRNGMGKVTNRVTNHRLATESHLANIKEQPRPGGFVSPRQQDQPAAMIRPFYQGGPGWFCRCAVGGSVGFRPPDFMLPTTFQRSRQNRPTCVSTNKIGPDIAIRPSQSGSGGWI